MQIFERLFKRRQSKHDGTDQAEMASAPQLGDACRDWRQGDVFHDAKTFVFGWDWTPRPVETVYGAVVVSQSCDASLPNRDRIQLAPVLRLEHPGDIKEAKAGKRPQYVAVPQLGEDFFADLDGITTVSKTALLSHERTSGVKTDVEVREFSFSVARRFGRFAYPDDVVKCLRPLTNTLQSKARKENSPLGQVLSNIHSFRVSCEDWAKSPYELTLIVILEPDLVPSDPEDIGTCPPILSNLEAKKPNEQISGCVAYLTGDDRTSTGEYFSWQILANAWALQCEENTSTLELTGIVRSVTAELAAVDDFPLSRYLTTESLDLDYLSDSRKPLG